MILYCTRCSNFTLTVDMIFSSICCTELSCCIVLHSVRTVVTDLDLNMLCTKDV